MKIRILLSLAALFIIFACESTTGPNEIGGNTDLELTKVGSEFGVSPKMKGIYSPALSNLRDTVKIIKNEGGIVTVKGKIVTDIDAVKALDTLFGTQNLPENIKHQIVDAYLVKYGLSIDTTDHQNMRLDFEFKMKVTSEGLQEFVYSKGDLTKPYTIVKYNSNVGDKYEFTTAEGEKITRTVVQKNEEEDWDLSFWKVKTIRVEQMMNDDPVIKKVTFITNHKFGLVGIIHEFKDGKIIETTILPWSML